MSAAAGWTVLLIGSAIALRGSAGGALSAPPLESYGELADWFDDRSPQVATMALIRLLAECAVWYLLARSAALLSAAAMRRDISAHALETTLPRFLRRLLDVGVGAGIVATTLSPAVDLVGAAEPPATEITPSGTATMRPVTASSSATATARPTPPSDGASSVAAATVEVSAGESFWVLAEETLASAWARTPSDAEIDPYWRDFVEANRHRLIDPGDPDHLVPGQVLELPAVPPPPA